MSFAPADDDPKVAVAVVVEDGGDAPEVSGNQLAAPIAQAVMQAVLGRVTAPSTDRVLGDALPADRADRRRRHGRGVARPRTTCSAATVAVKILRREYADDPTFLRAVPGRGPAHRRALAPGIAAVYDFGEGRDGGRLAVPRHGARAGRAAVGAVSPRGPARRRTARWTSSGRPRSALQAAHDAGVIHRDVKPGNILVTPDGDVKITDFGIARATNSVPLTQTGAIMGTAYYISPEQASGQSVTPASDVYSLGVVAYECLDRPAARSTATPRSSVALAQVQRGAAGAARRTCPRRCATW